MATIHQITPGQDASMLFRRRNNISAYAATIIASLWIWVPAASGGSPSLDEGARYYPIQSISYEFGSKVMRGYFVEESAICILTLMVTEKSDPEQPLALSPTRLRLELTPGQVAGVDSEEGQSINFTCDENATTLIVEIGARDQLVQLQDSAVRQYLAQHSQPN